MLAGLIIGDEPDQLFLLILRSIFRLRALALRRSLAFTRNPPLSECVEVLVTSNTHVKRRGFSSFYENLKSSFA